MADRRFAVEPWTLRETALDLGDLPRTESLFALANGHIGLRANLDEGEPFGLPGTYLNSFYELRPLPHAEAAYGEPESGQTIVNVTDGKIIRLLVDDEPLDVRYGTLIAHERTLDLRDGVLRRTFDWRSPAAPSRRSSMRSSRSRLTCASSSSRSWSRTSRAHRPRRTRGLHRFSTPRCTTRGARSTTRA